VVLLTAANNPVQVSTATAQNRPRWHRLPWIESIGIFILTFAALTALLWSFYRLVPSYEEWAVVWPFNGMFIGVLLMTPKRRWPWMLAGFLAAFVLFESHSKDEPSEIAIITLCSLAEVIITALALPPFRTLCEWIMEPYLMLRFTLVAVIGVPAAFSIPVSIYFHLHGAVPLWDTALIWGLGDAVGMSLSLPLVLVLISPETYELFRWQALPQTLGLLGGLCAVTWFVFHQQTYPLAYVPYPLLLLVALRLGFGGAVIGANMLAIVTVISTLNGFGPLRSLTATATFSEVFIVQIFCIFEVMLVFPLSISLNERRYFERQLKEAYADMERLAVTDKLTALANRRQFDQRLDFEWQRAIRTRRPLGLLMIDVDFFKSFNDAYGHVEGDACLQKIAAILTSCTFRRQDVIARYGGEEFAVLLPNAAEAAVATFAELICRNVRLAACPHGKSPSGIVTVSVGCAMMVPEMHTTPDILVIAADQALYKAKDKGRNRTEMAPYNWAPVLQTSHL